MRFGEGGHFDTFPLALSPYFGAMVARRAFNAWSDQGEPRRFELCEIGAGNGQLCLDALTYTATHAGGRGGSRWARFARALSYHIVEKSAALRRRQSALLGPFAAQVEWSALDLSRRRGSVRRGRHGFVVANEVLDCLAHHKVVLGRDGRYRVVFVGAMKERSSPSTGRAIPSSSDLLTHAQIDTALARGEKLSFREFLLPLESVSGLGAFLERHHDVQSTRRACRRLPWIYFACPSMERFVANTGALYDCAEILLIDYGGGREYHLGTPGGQRVAAGRPEEKHATPYRAPGRDDVTFLVDFSVAVNAAHAAGLEVVHFAPQGMLAALSGLRLGATALRTIIAHRALGWLLALSGVGPEFQQRAAAVSWKRPPRPGEVKTVAQEVGEAVDEFLGRRESTFHLLLLRKRATRS